MPLHFSIRKVRVNSGSAKILEDHDPPESPTEIPLFCYFMEIKI